jgi:thiol-disulfide isomerase/thioredoxin
MYKELKKDNLLNILEKNTKKQKTIVFFGTVWCGTCELLKPKFKELGKKTKDITFIYINADESPESKSIVDDLYNLPTFMGFIGLGHAFTREGSELDVVENIIEGLRMEPPEL